jgi:enoyl-CoA hydratase
LMQRAFAMAEHYAVKPPIAAQMIKRSINAIEAALDRSLMHMDADQNLLTQTTDDRRTAAATYRTGEKPVFNGD